MNLVNIAGRIAPLVSINWEGKLPGYYVRRITRDGLISGHLTQAGGWSTVYKAARFDTAEEALQAAGSARRVEVLANRVNVPADFNGCPVEGSAVFVQGQEFIVRNLTVEYLTGGQGAGYACRFTGECTANPCNDSIRHTSYNGGRYGWRVYPKS